MTFEPWWQVGAVVFAAGAAWAQLKTIRKDLNGLGSKLGRMEGELDRDAYRSAILAIACAKDEDSRRWLADKWLERIK